MNSREAASAKRACKTCRYWDVHSVAALKGDCRAPNDHRYSRVLIDSRRPDGSTRSSYALMDSFGPEETLPGYTCGAWKPGLSPQASDLTLPSKEPQDRDQ